MEHSTVVSISRFHWGYPCQSLTGAGIFDGDVIVVDRSVEVKSGNAVVAILNGEFTIKRLHCSGAKIELVDGDVLAVFLK